jgi:hypothetical protein
MLRSGTDLLRSGRTDLLCAGCSDLLCPGRSVLWRSRHDGARARSPAGAGCSGSSPRRAGSEAEGLV